MVAARWPASEKARRAHRLARRTHRGQRGLSSCCGGWPCWTTGSVRGRHAGARVVREIYSHNDRTIPGHVLAANEVDLGEEGDDGPGGNAAQRAVEKVGVRHHYDSLDGGREQVTGAAWAERGPRREEAKKRGPSGGGGAMSSDLAAASSTLPAPHASARVSRLGSAPNSGQQRGERKRPTRIAGPEKASGQGRHRPISPRRRRPSSVVFHLSPPSALRVRRRHAHDLLSRQQCFRLSLVLSDGPRPRRRRVLCALPDVPDATRRRARGDEHESVGSVTECDVVLLTSLSPSQVARERQVFAEARNSATRVRFRQPQSHRRCVLRNPSQTSPPYARDPIPPICTSTPSVILSGTPPRSCASFTRLPSPDKRDPHTKHRSSYSLLPIPRHIARHPGLRRASAERDCVQGSAPHPLSLR